MKVKSECEVTLSCPTPSDPMDCSPPGSPVGGIFQARVLEWVAVAFSPQAGDLKANFNPVSFVGCVWIESVIFPTFEIRKRAL